MSVGGAILVVARGRSEPPRHLEVSTPGRGAEENKRPRPGPEYPFHEPSTSRHDRFRYPHLNTATSQTPHPTVTASVDGPVGYASLELAVLACPRSTRCLYVIKTLDVWKNSRPAGRHRMCRGHPASATVESDHQPTQRRGDRRKVTRKGGPHNIASPALRKVNRDRPHYLLYVSTCQVLQ